ncbi:MAG: hypothetical protein IPK82_19005 [Polyangiaceae bacterium]|nr:hypothetical protein [Polyangiaceae bacterium]
MIIDNQIGSKKAEILAYFRSRAAERVVDIDATFGAAQSKKRASAFNRAIAEERDRILALILQAALRESWSNSTTLPIILLVQYCSSVVMIEGRNAIRPYEYMDFSRRVGEIWEPLCKKCFDLPVNSNVTYYVPPLFDNVKRRLTEEVENFIQGLNLSDVEKESLLRYYSQVWQLVSPGEVNLATDIHVVAADTRYVIELKTGFGSNEKGNLNRLLLVASVYRTIEPENYDCLLLVRSTEDSNNSYLKTLKNSGLWRVSCGTEAYEQIGLLSGFNLRAWVEANVEWTEDLNDATVRHLRDESLLTYLDW